MTLGPVEWSTGRPAHSSIQQCTGVNRKLKVVRKECKGNQRYLVRRGAQKRRGGARPLEARTGGGDVNLFGALSSWRGLASWSVRRRLAGFQLLTAPRVATMCTRVTNAKLTLQVGLRKGFKSQSHSRAARAGGTRKEGSCAQHKSSLHRSTPWRSDSSLDSANSLPLQDASGSPPGPFPEQRTLILSSTTRPSDVTSIET